MKVKDVLRLIQRGYKEQTGVSRDGVEWLAQETEEYIVIAFRGSKMTGKTWYYDTWRNIRALVPWYNKIIGWSSQGYISGCLCAINDIESYAINNNPGKKPIIVSGHSLGAALSFLTGIILHSKGHKVIAWVGVGTVNCMIKHSTPPFKCLNYKYEEDIVPTYPPKWLGFTPPVPPVHLGKDDSKLFSIGDFKDHKLLNYIEYVPDIEI
jgi:hypothetical protein